MSFIFTKWCSRNLLIKVNTNLGRIDILVNNAIIERGLVATEFVDNITDPAAKQALEARFKAVTPLQPEDIVQAITYAVTHPSHVNVNEILIRPTQQE